MSLEIIIDTREKKSIFDEYCVLFPAITFHHEKLDAGDYYAKSAEVLVERKTIGDLCESIFGPKQLNGRSRIHNETDKLATHEDKIVLFLIIGSVDSYIRDMKSIEIDINESIIYGEIASLMTREKFHVIWTHDEINAKFAMIRFMQAVYDGKYGIPARRDPIKLMARILKITPEQLKQLLTTYKTIHNLSIQPPENYTVVKGIAEKRAEFICNILNTEWEE
ncbi:MAG: hypothetical protein M0R80_09710 [Proteobacteria bacterium]|jgi:ERCC4-type nuclease|nr:hypothetical protein [Pseudomonadota bacterium]